MEWRESINEIRKARDEDRLVIFVGSGVSANSEVPTWGKLIEEIAKKIKYDKCGECKKDCFDKKNCKDRYNFNQDEYLRIPEYFYKSCKNKAAYYKFIKKVLLPEGSSFKPNAIDDIIFDILPDHIITTNYDSLLEDSESVNAGMYTVISDDKELINNAGKNYIIKMHGTFENPESMILKESDYIEYDHTHPLISTFIKGILVNHSFLFIGYSLNDYNLKLIMGWINYYRKQYEQNNGQSKTVRHFVVNTEKVSDYEMVRLSDNNIEVIDLTSMSDDAKNDFDAREKLSGEKGRLLYTYLSCIENDRKFEKYCKPEDFFLNKCEVLKSYRKINIGDLNAVYNLGHDHIEGTGIVFNNSANFEKIAKLIDTKDNSIIDVFQRSRITHLEWRDPFRKIVRSVIKDIPSKESDYSVVINGRKLAIDKAFKLYLDNDYITLRDYAKNTEDLDEKICYHTIFGECTKIIQAEIKKKEKDIKSCDYVSMMMHKSRVYLSLYARSDKREQKTDEIKRLFESAPQKYIKAVQYFRRTTEINTAETSVMSDLLEKQEKKYREGRDMSYPFEYIKRIQAYAYNYYLFLKENLLPLDIYTNPKDYLKYYLKAILSSYIPLIGQDGFDFFGTFIKTHMKPYSLNEIDLNMIVKFMTTKELKSSISKYHVQYLNLDEDIDVVGKYKRLCDSYTVYGMKVFKIMNGTVKMSPLNLEEKLCNFSIILCLLNLDNSAKIDIFKSCFEAFKTKVSEDEEETGAFEALAYLINNLKADDDKMMGEVLDFLIEKYDLISSRFSSTLSQTIFKLSPYVKPSTVCKVKRVIEKLKTDQKISKIYTFRYILPMEEYRDYLNANMELINNTKRLFDFAVGGYIEDKNKIMEIITESIGKETDKGQLSKSKNIPFSSQIKIEHAVLLKIIFPEVNIDILKPYAKYSPHLQFICDPENFDYSQIDTSDYMWENLFKSKQYRKYFIEHKKEILNDNLKNIFETERENRVQQKIVYGVLLDEDEIWDFPERWGSGR